MFILAVRLYCLDREALRRVNFSHIRSIVRCAEVKQKSMFYLFFPNGFSQKPTADFNFFLTAALYG